MNVSIAPDQSHALCGIFKYIEKDVHEICFANNNMNDDQFAEILTAIIEEEKQYNNLERITYGSNNELGYNSVEMLDQFIGEKNPQFPLTHLALVNCKKRIATIEPLLITLQEK